MEVPRAPGVEAEVAAVGGVGLRRREEVWRGSVGTAEDMVIV